MRVDNDAFALKNAEPVKRPHYTIAIAFDDPPTDYVYLTSSRYAEAPAASVAADEVIYGVVKGISGQSQQIMPDEGRSTIGTFTFEVTDKDEALTVYMRDKLTAGHGLRNKRMELWVGYDGLLWAEYEKRLTYIISGNPSYKNGTYKFTCSDIQRQLRDQIFTAEKKRLSKSVTATQTHIPVLTSDLTLFPVVAHDQSYSDRPSLTVGYGLIEDEIFCHTGLFTHGTDGTSFQIATNGRGALNSKATEHVLDASAASDRAIEIKEYIHLEGPAPKVIYAFLTGVLYGQFDTASPPVQLTLPDNMNMGVSTDLVRLADFTSITPDLWNTSDNTGRHVRFSGVKETDGKRFIEKE